MEPAKFLAEKLKNYSGATFPLWGVMDLERLYDNVLRANLGGGDTMTLIFEVGLAEGSLGPLRFESDPFTSKEDALNCIAEVYQVLEAYKYGEV